MSHPTDLVPFGEQLADTGLAARVLDDGRISLAEDDALPDEERVVISSQAAGLTATGTLFACEDATVDLLNELETLSRGEGPLYQWEAGQVVCEEILPWSEDHTFPCDALRGLFDRVNAGFGERSRLQELSAAPAPASLPPSFLPGAGQSGDGAGATQRYGHIDATPGRAELESGEIAWQGAPKKPSGGSNVVVILVIVGLGLFGLVVVGGMAVMAAMRPTAPVGPGPASTPSSGPSPAKTRLATKTGSGASKTGEEPDATDPTGETGGGDETSPPAPKPGSPYELASSVNPGDRLLGLKRWREKKEDILEGARLKMLRALDGRQGRAEELILLESVRKSPPGSFEAIDCIQRLPSGSPLWRELVVQLSKKPLTKDEKDIAAEVLAEAKDTKDLLIEESLIRIGRAKKGSAMRLVAARGPEWLEFGDGQELFARLPLSEQGSLLQSDSAKVRQIGLQLVSATGQEGEAREALKILAGCLSSKDTELKRRAIEELGGLGEGIAAWYLALGLMREEDDRSRELMRNSLSRLPAADATTWLAKLAKHKQADRRRAAISALAVVETEESVKVMIAALRDSDRGVRLEALEALSALRQNSELKIHVRTGIVDYRRIAKDRSDPDARRIARQLCLAIDGRLPQ